MNKDNTSTVSNSAPALCDSCGELSLHQTCVVQSFPYRKEGEEVQLTAEVPAWRCTNCGFEFTDGDAEEVRHEAVCRYLGVLSPREVRELRSNYRLTQSEFAQLTGFGEASIKRWETGLNIQNKAADKLLRLLRDRRIYEMLRAPDKASAAETLRTRRGKFKTELSASVFFAASIFELRPNLT